MLYFAIIKKHFKICRGGGTGRHAVLRGQWAMLVRVRVPLSAPSPAYLNFPEYSSIITANSDKDQASSGFHPYDQELIVQFT